MAAAKAAVLRSRWVSFQPTKWVIFIPTLTAERTHSGKYCYGKTPLQTFIESATLAYDKQLDRIKPTSEPVSARA